MKTPKAKRKSSNAFNCNYFNDDKLGVYIDS